MRNLKYFSAVSALAILVGCASTPSAPEQTLEERAQARWEHIFAEEYPEALAYYTPGYRQITSPAEYEIWVKSRPVRWTGADVKTTECESEERCTVITAISYRIPRGPTGMNNMSMMRDIEETWLKFDGAWFYAPD